MSITAITKGEQAYYLKFMDTVRYLMEEEIHSDSLGYFYNSFESDMVPPLYAKREVFLAKARQIAMMFDDMLRANYGDIEGQMYYI